MKHLFRFYGQKADKNHWILGGEETQHLSKVLRLKSGAEIEVFDGSGKVAKGHICAISKKETKVEVYEESSCLPPKPELIICMGALKPSSMDKVFAPLVELGVDQFVLFIQGQSQKNRIQDKVLERWNRIIVGSSKQCKRVFLPKIHTYKNLEECIASEITEPELGMLKLHISEFGEYPNQSKILPSTTKIFYVVGSESGLNDSEQALLKDRNFLPISLSNNILTAYTANIAATSLLSTWRLSSTS